MLSSLLPGLRQLRVPLASGALWLTFLAVITLPLHTEMSSIGFFAAISDAVAWAGVAPTLGVLAFVAYLTGITLNVGGVSSHLARTTDQVEAAGRRMEGRVRKSLEDARERGVTPWQVREALPELRRPWEAHKEFRKKHPSEPSLRERLAAIAGPVSREADKLAEERVAWSWLNERVTNIAQSICFGAAASDDALLLTHPALHAQIDRERAEGEFRRAIAVPVALLGIAIGLALAPDVPLWAALFSGVLGVALGYFMLLSGHRLLSSAMISTWGYIVDGLVPSADLAAIDELRRIPEWDPEQLHA